MVSVHLICPRIGLRLDTQQHMTTGRPGGVASPAGDAAPSHAQAKGEGPTSALNVLIKGIDLRIPDSHRITFMVGSNKMMPAIDDVEMDVPLPA